MNNTGLIVLQGKDDLLLEQINPDNLSAEVIPKKSFKIPAVLKGVAPKI